MAIPKGQFNAGDIDTLGIKRKHYISRDWNLEQVIEVANQHAASTSQYQILYDYYKGMHTAILSRTFDDVNKPNNKVVHNFPKLLVDTATSYLVGEPITLKGDEKTIDAIMPVLKENYYTDVDTEIIKKSAIFGHAFEIHWIDKNNKLRFKAVSPMNCLIAYSFDLEEEPVVAIYYNNVGMSLDNKFIRAYEIYTDDKVYKFTTETPDEPDARAEVRNLREFPNLLKRFPVIETICNEERIGDFEAQISLIDSYNIAVSDSINDIVYWNDAYLWLNGFEAADEDAIANMKNNKVIVTDGQGNVSFVVKDVNDKHIENVKNRAKQDIFTFSQIPDIASKDFNAASGTAMKAATQPLENKSAMKEAKYRKTLEQRFKIICSYLDLMGKYKLKDLKPEELEPVFIRNLPQSYSELADMAVKLRDILSDQTIVGLFPFITDAKEEIAKADKQREDRAKKALEGFKQTKVGAGVLNPNKVNKIDNNANTNAITTTDEVAAKEQEKARNKKPKE